MFHDPQYYDIVHFEKYQLTLVIMRMNHNKIQLQSYNVSK